MMAPIKILIKSLLFLLLFLVFLYISYILIQLIANNLDFFFRECGVNLGFDVCNLPFLLVDLDFLKNALTGLAGNIITLFTISGLSSIILYVANALKLETIKNIFGLTETNTAITILVSNVNISDQITGRRWKNEKMYPEYKGSSLVLNEYEAALSIKDIFKKKKLLLSLQDLLGFINSDFLKSSFINVEIVSCPDNASELKALIDDTVVKCTRSLIVLGSPVNNQLTAIPSPIEMLKDWRLSRGLLGETESNHQSSFSLSPCLISYHCFNACYLRLTRPQ